MTEGLRNYGAQDALTMMGLGLLNLSQGKSPINALLTPILHESHKIPENFLQNEKNNPGGEERNTFGGGTLSKLVNSIGKLESSNNYASVGPMTKHGDRAFGRYQVMGANIPIWTKEVLGRSMTPHEFLQDEQAQDAVAQAKLGSYLNKFGNIDDAASMWFSGRPLKNNQSRDVLGTSVPDYVKKINQYFYA